MTTQTLDEKIADGDQTPADVVVDNVEKETPPQHERTEVSPVKLNVEISKNPDFSKKSEVIKAVFIQFGTEHSGETKWQLDEPQPGVLTLTSFVYPTMQFLYADEAPEAAYVGIFPADDAAAVASLILSMRERLNQHSMQLGISGVIAPVIDGQQRRSLTSGMGEVYEITAVTSIERSRRLLKDMKERKDAGKEPLNLEEDETVKIDANEGEKDEAPKVEAETQPEVDSNEPAPNVDEVQTDAPTAETASE